MIIHFRNGVSLIVLVALVVSLMICGCSDEAKNEAAKLEQELSDQGTEVVSEDSTPTDSMTAVEADMDARAVPEEKTSVIAGPSGSGYAVQVASCESRDYADYLVDKYTGRGYLAYLTAFDHNGQTYFRVRLGPYETAEEAGDVKVMIKDKYSVEAWIGVE